MQYNKILFNEVIYFYEQKWNVKLSDEQINILIEGYVFGRQVEAECEIKILDAK